MTTTTDQLARAHPLELVTAEEIREARRIADGAGLVSESTRFVYVGLQEPAKADLLAERGVPSARRFRLLLLDLATQVSRDVVVDLAGGKVVSEVELDTTVTGQLPVLDEEFELVEQLLVDDERWLAALAARELPVEKVRVAPLSAGVYAEEYPDEAGRRILRGLAFVQEHEADHAWAHPVDGLVAYVDTINRRVDQVIDTGVVPVPDVSGNFDAPAVTGPVRTTQKPIEITQPQGSSLELDGNLLTWEKWSLQVGFDAREGLVLHRIGFDEGDGVRPILHRASIAEMVVPYADPSPVRPGRTTSTPASTSFGRYTNALELGCDCLGEIKLPRRRDRRRARRAQDPAERRLHPRGGLRCPLEAHRHVDRVAARPAASVAWSSPSSPPSATTTTASTGTSTSTAPSA